MRTFLLFALCSALMATTLQASPQMSIYEAINKAGYQRMLTQRIAKCYLTIVVDMEAEKYKAHLKGSAKIFEDNLKDLQQNAYNDEVKEQLRYVEILWRNYKFIYTDDFSKENALVILEFNNKILKACNRAVELLEEYALQSEGGRDQELRVGDKELSQIINKSGRQRMLTQRIALYAIAKAFKIGNADQNIQHYNEAVTSFDEAYKQLMAYAKNTAQIDEEYTKISSNWSALEEGLTEVLKAAEMGLEIRETLKNALKKGEQILFSFDEIVFLYEREQH